MSLWDAFLRQRRAVRSMPNPLDKSTVVSIYPRNIIEVKHTIQPGIFKIEAGSYEKPSILVVGMSSWWMDPDPDRPLVEIPTSSITVADSIVTDYCNGLLGCDMANLMPGLFYLPGELTVAEIVKNHKIHLDRMLVKQKNWYMQLVKMADSLWAASQGNPMSISDDMRLAATELNLQDKEWIKDFSQVKLERCPACGTLGNPLFPICSNCKHVKDPEAAKKLNLQFAS